MYTGEADHALTAELVDHVDVPVIASGDVTSRDKALAVLERRAGEHQFGPLVFGQQCERPQEHALLSVGVRQHVVSRQAERGEGGLVDRLRHVGPAGGGHHRDALARHAAAVGQLARGAVREGEQPRRAGDGQPALAQLALGGGGRQGVRIGDVRQGGRERRGGDRRGRSVERAERADEHVGARQGGLLERRGGGVHGAELTPGRHSADGIHLAWRREHDDRSLLLGELALQRQYGVAHPGVGELVAAGAVATQVQRDAQAHVPGWSRRISGTAWTRSRGTRSSARWAECSATWRRR